jgi:hypothetical protein
MYWVKTVTMKVSLRQLEWAHALLRCSWNNWEKWLLFYACLYVCMEQLRSHWMVFCGILYWRVLLKCHNQVQFWLQNDKNSRHLTWTTYTFHQILLGSKKKFQKEVLQGKHIFPWVFLKILLITSYKKYGRTRGQRNRWQSICIVPSNVTVMPPN